MKISKEYLKKVITEEIMNVLEGEDYDKNPWSHVKTKDPEPKDFDEEDEEKSDEEKEED